MAKVTQVPLNELKTSFFVRKKLDEKHVMQLALLYEAGEQLPPLSINYDNEVIDGRHRKAALELLGRTHADCMSVGQKGSCESVVLALKANVGGSLPPTKDDIVHTMILLLNEGWNERKVLDNMPFPRAVARKYIADAWSVVLNAKLHGALKAMAEGMTVKDAAAKFGVPIEKIQDHLNPNRKKRQTQSIAHKKSKLSRSFLGFHRKVAYEIQSIFNGYEDHDISESEVLELFESIYSLFRKGEKNVDNHMERFKAMAKTASTISKVDAPRSAMKIAAQQQ